MSVDSTSEWAIFERVVLPRDGGLSQDAARSLLAMAFTPQDQERMKLLAEKARDGSLSIGEQREIENYERVGHYLSIFKSKARMVLQSTHGIGS